MIHELATAGYGAYALTQALELDELAPFSERPKLVAAQPIAPAWFAAAAAAADSTDLLATAPELIASVPAHGMSFDSDLVAIYAPEFRDQFDAPKVPRGFVEPPPPAPSVAPATPRTSVQMGLLRELSDLDD